LSRAPASVSLERALSKLRLVSRREARALILDGRVRVNGALVREPGTPVEPERIDIDIAASMGTALAPAGLSHRARSTPRRLSRLIALHKPRGVLTTRRDPEGRRTVFDVLGEAGVGLVAVGRLDRASTGLLLLTDDTQLAHRLTDPANGVLRRYVVTVRGRLSAADAGRLERGIDLAGETEALERLAARRVDIRKASGRETHLIVDLVEGRHREIRRLCAAVGHEVTRLHRVSFGPVALGDLAPGAWREVPAREVRRHLSALPL
jgi:23S rRNA pseudouridine2605 synthase